jgi:AraC-like DNA-binding protein
MRRVRLVRVTKTILPIVAFAADSGVAPPELLCAAGLDPALLVEQEIDLPHSQELRLWDEAARLIGDQDFGVHFAEWLTPRTEEQFDVLAFAVRSCATLGENYRRAARYLRLVHSGIWLSLEDESDLARLVHGHHEEPPESPRHPVEGMLALALLQGRRAIGEEFAPRAVCFAHARPDRTSEQERIFGAQVHYDCPRNELVLDSALLARPQRQAEPRLLAMLERQLEGLLSELPDIGSPFRDAVQRSMKDELPDREPSTATIAAMLHMSPRSLQRRLESEGTSFAEVLADLRRDLALRYLRDERMSIGEVGFLLGFQDVSAFHRAFKRWTGSTPAEYQRNIRADRGARA